MLKPKTNPAWIPELENIAANSPLWPGDTLSHATANECVARGYARREGGNFVITEVGRTFLRALETLDP